MFFRKNKHTGDKPIAYDVGKYEQARHEWLNDKPVINPPELPSIIYPSGMYALYMGWSFSNGSLLLNVYGKDANDNDINFSANLSKDHVRAFYYTLSAARDAQSCYPQGCVLVGDSFYLPMFVNRSVKIERHDDDYRYFVWTWTDHDKNPMIEIEQTYSVLDIDLLIDALKLFIDEYTVFSDMRADWLEEEPQKWQYPPTYDD